MIKVSTIILFLLIITSAIAANIRVDEGKSLIQILSNVVVVNNTQTWNIVAKTAPGVEEARIYTYLNDTMNASEVNNAIDDTTMIVMFLKGDYYMDQPIWLKSNKTYIINPGVTISWAANATPYNYKLHSDTSPNWFGNVSFILWAEDQENIQFLNYGDIHPTRIWKPFPNEMNNSYSIAFMHTDNVFAHVGKIQANRLLWSMGARAGDNTWNNYMIAKNEFGFDSPSYPNNISSEGSSGAGIECARYGIIENIMGNSGGEGIDFNNKGANIIASEFIYLKRPTDSTELVDVDSSSQILFTNSLGINYDNVATVQPTSGFRHADCSLPYTGNRNVHVKATCYDCKAAADFSVVNATLIVADNTQMYYSNASIDMQGNNITNVKNLTLVNGTTWS